MSKSIAVFGIGRFGRSLALTLSESGADVMAVDGDESVIEKIADKVTYAITADLKSAEAIQALGREEMDAVVVAMGSDLKASIMSVMVSKELGVPFVMAKAADDRMGAILTKVGADKIIYPEEETGIRTARVLASDTFAELFDIDDNLSIIEMKPRKDWIGKNLIELNLRGRFNVNVIAIKDANKMQSSIDPKKPLDAEDTLYVIIDKKDIRNIQ